MLLHENSSIVVNKKKSNIRGAVQIVALLCLPWVVRTPPIADAPVGVCAHRQQFGMHSGVPVCLIILELLW